MLSFVSSFSFDMIHYLDIENERRILLLQLICRLLLKLTRYQLNPSQKRKRSSIQYKKEIEMDKPSALSEKMLRTV